MGKKCIGVDVGGTSVKLGLFQITGELLKKWEIPTRKEEQGKYIIGDVADSIRQVLAGEIAGESISFKDIAGVGILDQGAYMTEEQKYELQKLVRID